MKGRAVARRGIHDNRPQKTLRLCPVSQQQVSNPAAVICILESEQLKRSHDKFGDLP